MPMSADRGKANRARIPQVKELAQVRIFARVGPEELAQLGKIAMRESFKPDTVVFFQGG
jgi:hypothetical protein